MPAIDLELTDPMQRNLRRLLLLRFTLIAGALWAVYFAHNALQTPIAENALILLFGAWILAALRSWWKTGRTQRTGERDLAVHLAFDTVALTLALYFSGGAASPFTPLYLICVSIAVVSLHREYWTWALLLLSIICYSALLLLPAPFARYDLHHSAAQMSLHIFGMWIGIIAAACFIAIFAISMKKVLHQRDRELEAARAQRMHEEKLVELGILAAGAAHELGTPLATMAIVADELREHHDHPQIVQKAELIRGQISRCKQALAVLSATSGQAQALGGGSAPLARYLEDLIDDWHKRHPETTVRRRWRTTVPDLRIVTDQSLTHAITNLLNNAAEVSREVDITLACDTRHFSIDIGDRGPGFPPELRENLGRKLYSGKPGYGLGIGIFLSCGTIQRLGGSVEAQSRRGGGSTTTIRLPLAALAIEDDKSDEHTPPQTAPSRPNRRYTAAG